MAAAFVLLPVSLRAQEAAPGATPAAPGAAATTRAPGTSSAAEVAALAEQIAVLRAVTALRATPAQWDAMATAVNAAHQRLTQQAQTDLQALAALREPVMRARQQLLPLSANPNDPRVAAAMQAEQRVTAAQQAAMRNQSRLRDELSRSLRQQLETLLTPAQAAAVVTQGRSLLAAERQQEDRLREQRLQQSQRSAAVPPGADRGRGGPGGRDFSTPEGTQRMLERLRSADTNSYQRMSRGLARRFGDEGTPGYQNALAMFDQIRSMPGGQFRRQRAQITGQTMAAMSAARLPANAAYTINPQNAMESWIQRYLLSPQAPTALKELTAARSGG